MPAIFIAGLVLLLFAGETPASPVNSSRQAQALADDVYNFTTTLDNGNDRRGNWFVLDNTKLEQLLINLSDTLMEFVLSWNDTTIERISTEVATRSTNIPEKRSGRTKRTIAGMERWNSLMDPFIEFGAAVMGSVALKDNCIDRLVCLVTTFLPEFPGRNIALVLLEGLVPTGWNPYFKGAKASLLMSENCQRYPCFSGLL